MKVLFNQVVSGCILNLRSLKWKKNYDLTQYINAHSYKTYIYKHMNIYKKTNKKLYGMLTLNAVVQTLASTMNTHLYTQHNKDERHSSLEKYTSHFIERVVWERELETEQNCNILTPILLAITALFPRSPGLLNRRPGGPVSLGAGFLYSILSPTRLIPNSQSGAWGLCLLGAGFFYRILSPTGLVSKLIWSPTRLISNWLNFLCTELYNSSTSTFFLWVSQFRTHSTCPLSRL